jgi:RNA polymerase sigma factor (sigma-70 family)
VAAQFPKLVGRASARADVNQTVIAARADARPTKFLCGFNFGGCYNLKMTPDPELLCEFTRTNSEAAFAELVKRHVNLVYSAALRQMNGDEHLAKDVAQMVFTALARKAGSLSRRESLSGWLYTSAHFAAAKIVRGENRRRDREEKFMREPTSETAPEADWEKLCPTLDDAMHELKETDREAVLLRYFENRQFAEVGAKLGLNENAARMRVERALEKLRGIFEKRGITTATTFASVISANAIQIAPVNLAATLTTVSIATAGTGTFTLLKIMTATKLKLAFSVLVVVGAATAFVIQNQAQEKLRAENESLTQQIASLQNDNENFSNQLAEVGDAKKLSDDQFSELLKLRGEVGVLRNQVAETASSYSDLTTNSWQSRFDAVYKLKADEVVRYIPPPFIPERAEYYHKTEEWHDSAEHISTPPDFFIFHQDTNELFHRHGPDGGFGYKLHSLQQVLNATLGINESELEAPKELLDLNLPGDWTIRDGVSQETFLAALEPILLKATGHSIHFEKKLVQSDAIIAQGQFTIETWQKTLSQPIQIYSETTNYTKGRFLGNGFGDLQEFLKRVGERLNIYIVNDAQTDSRLPEPFQFQWTYHSDADAPRMGSRRSELTDKVLNNLAAQTGLSFMHTNQAVEVWAIVEAQ